MQPRGGVSQVEWSLQPGPAAPPLLPEAAVPVRVAPERPPSVRSLIILHQYLKHIFVIFAMRERHITKFLNLLN